MQNKCGRCGGKHHQNIECVCPRCDQQHQGGEWNCALCAICGIWHASDICLHYTMKDRCKRCGQKHHYTASCPCPHCHAYHDGDQCYDLFTTSTNNRASSEISNRCLMCGQAHNDDAPCPCPRCHRSHQNDDCLTVTSDNMPSIRYIVLETPCSNCNCWHGGEECPAMLYPMMTLDLPRQCESALLLRRAMSCNSNVTGLLQAPTQRDAASARHSIGSMHNQCPHCRARFWPGESINCCYDGTLILPEPIIPEILQRTIQSATVMANIRQYNMAMAMASVGHNNQSLRGGTFVMAGKSYHRIGTMLPSAGSEPNFAQIYILDTEDATLRRQTLFRNTLEDQYLNILHAQLIEHNPYVEQFRQAVTNETSELTWSSEDNIMGMQLGAILSNPGHARRIVVRRVANTDENALTFISDSHPLYHTLAYPLLFPTGATGWHNGMKRCNLDNLTEHTVTLTDYGRCMLMHRDAPTHIQKCGRLAIEFYCDAWAQQEARSAMFHSLPSQQSRYRVGRKCAVEDQLYREGDPRDVTIPMILPSSFVGSSKWYHMLYLDALTLPTRYHAPDLFITFTCNHKWPEIVNSLPIGSNWTLHPDIVARVFWLKMKSMMSDIVEHQLFGKVMAFVWRIEWQARGLPHAHILIILEVPLRTPRQIDAIVSAEIPDSDLHPELHTLVRDMMIHTPCDDNREAGCRKDQSDSSCKRHFPKQMSSTTTILANKFPKYRRRGIHTCNIKGRIVTDDWVVPYSPFLMLRYGAHINVEVAAHIKTFKYVYKYVLKSPDTAVVSINEIEAHLSGRLLSASEAVWRFLGLPLHKEHPPVMRLDIHLPNEHCVIFASNDDTDTIQNAATNSTSTLLEWFQLNCRDEEARSYLYSEIPEHYSWNKKEKVWTKRQKNGICVGRLYSVSSRNQELFALKRLLSVIKGPQSWSDLLTVENYCYSNFQQACGARGMLQDDSDIIDAFQEIVRTMCSLEAIRREFAMILLNRTCHNAVMFFEMFASHLCEDHTVTTLNCTVALWAIEDIMTEHGRSLQDKDYGFTLPEQPHSADLSLQHLLRCHVFDPEESVRQSGHYIAQFTSEQNEAMNAVIDAVEERCSTNVLAVLASAGSGKSCFVNGVTWILRSQQKIVINIAASALAATLLPNGKTAHSAFRIPIPTNNTSFCGLKTSERELIRQCTVIFYDEISMVNKDVADTIDRSLKEITGIRDKPFGGKVMVFLGDFKQLLPVVPGSRCLQTVKDCEWWQHVKVMKFTKNWRAAQNPEFARLIENVGNGLLDTVVVPQSSRIDNIQQLIIKVYGHDMTLVPQNLNMILALTLETCKNINNICLQALPDPGMEAYSYDDTKDNKHQDQYTPEYLASLPLHGVPPATLTLKTHGRYMITKNYDVARGIVNGTLCEMLTYSRNIVQLKLLTGTQKNRIIQLPRCSCHVSPENSGLPFSFNRVQFPLMPAYCVSVHKSQGQSLENVGLCIDQDCFAHGQL